MLKKWGDHIKQKKALFIFLLISGVVCLVVALCLINATSEHLEQKQWFKYAFAAYAFAAAGIILIRSTYEEIDISFFQASFDSFVLWVMVVPVWGLLSNLPISLLERFLILVLTKNDNPIFQLLKETQDSVILSQILMIILWFGHKIFFMKDKDELTFTKLDFYATLVILPLTIIWVRCNLDGYEFGFAFILGLFMTIQLFIKGASIKYIEQEKCKELRRNKIHYQEK